MSIIELSEKNKRNRIQSITLRNLVNMGSVKLRKIKKRTPMFHGEKSVELYKKALQENKSITSLMKIPVWVDTFIYHAKPKTEDKIIVPSGILSLDLSRQKRGMLIKLFAITFIDKKGYRNITYNNIKFIADFINSNNRLYQEIKEVEKIGLIKRNSEYLYISHVFMPEYITEKIENMLIGGSK